MAYEETTRCAVCGNSLELSEAEELYEGCLCPQCAEKLSPWFNDFDTAEPEEIRRQILLRKENPDKLRHFHPTRKFGGPTMIVVDDEAKTFVITESCHLLEENPEVITFDQVIDCSVDIEEERENLGGRNYLYTYSFTVHLDLDHPYLSEIFFPFTEEPLSYESSEKSFMGFGGFDPEEDEEYAALAAEAGVLEDVLMDLEDPEDRTSDYDVEPGEFDLSAGQTEELPAQAEGAPASMICPWCGCRTRITENFRCEHCDGTL